MIDTYKWRICYTKINFQVVAETTSNSIDKAKRFVEIISGMKLQDMSFKYYPDFYGSGKGHGVIIDLILAKRLGGTTNVGYA